MWLPCYLSALKWKAVTVLFWMHLLWAQQCCIGSEAKFNQWLVSTKNTWWEDKHHDAGLCRTLSVWGCKSKHQRCFISPLQSPVFYRRLRLKGWHFNLWLLTSTAMRWGASCIRSPRLWLLQNTCFRTLFTAGLLIFSPGVIPATFGHGAALGADRECK